MQQSWCWWYRIKYTSVLINPLALQDCIMCADLPEGVRLAVEPYTRA